MLIFTASTFKQPKTNIASLYCQGSTLPGIIYVGMIQTTEHKPVVYQCLPPTFLSYECTRNILTATRFSLVNSNNPYCDFFLFCTPGKKDHLTIDVHFQLDYLNGVHTEEVDLLEFKQNNDLPPWYPVLQIAY